MTTTQNLSRTALLPGWKLIIARDYEHGSVLAADWLKTELRQKPDLLLCAATGGSPTLAYELFSQSLLSLNEPSDQLRLLKLDEWGGLPMNDPASCEAHLQRLLIQPLKIDANRLAGFQSDASDPDAECERIETWLRTHGPIDVCVLGLGINGHLGFNEPAEELPPGCHVAELAEESRSHAMLAETARRPRYGLTLGLRDILAARKILLLVFGTTKAAQLERLLTGGLASRFPASFLALHPSVHCICDEAAAARLPDELRRDSVVEDSSTNKLG